MNSEIIIHPKLQHYGLITANLDTMIDWYRKVLGMTINHRSLVPARAQNRAPFSAMAFVSNDEVNHRIVSLRCTEPSSQTNAGGRYSMSLSSTKHSTICLAPTLGSRT